MQESGKYIVKLYDGRKYSWVGVEVDDYLPCTSWGASASDDVPSNDFLVGGLGGSCRKTFHGRPLWCEACKRKSCVLKNLV